MIKSLLTAATLALFPCLPTPATAQVPDGIVTLNVLPGWRTEHGTHMVGLRITLADGWKTYWRAPGEGGIPPRFNWDGSENVTSMRIHWPRPGVFEANGIRSIGYADEVVLPMEFTPNDRNQPIQLRGQVELGVCETVCVPISLRLRADLPAGAANRNADILDAMADAPASQGSAGVRSVQCKVEPIADGLRLTAQITMPPVDGTEVAVVELPDQRIWVSEAASTRSGETLTASVDMVPPNAQPFLLDRSDVRITVLGATRAVNIEGCTGS
ncbi:protein-disulfide reductase DsbD domain-containing protein [Aliiroseovarius sp. YM-037]|uniref:protein-disulfide reductase DsbD domain-containing protein n=1 Tax=Aliiroseovarius sp. YM-037 TaxID=3341728 RepID=UPI003A8104A0